MEFKQPTETETILKRLPSVAMEFNGEYIENELNGYETLKVSGRETIGVELISEPTHEGVITIDERLPHRELTITYELQADNNAEFQERFKALRKLLTSNEQVPIKFLDEPDTVYFGRLSAMDTVPDDSNTIINTFTVICDSPYKFSDLVVTNGDVTIDTFYPTLLEQIEVLIGATTNKLEITNGDYRITATGTFNAGSKVVILFQKEEVTMTVNGSESTYMIDLQSDLENFVLKQGQDVTCEQGNITLKMRERWL